MNPATLESGDRVYLRVAPRRITVGTVRETTVSPDGELSVTAHSADGQLLTLSATDVFLDGRAAVLAVSVASDVPLPIAYPEITAEFGAVRRQIRVWLDHMGPDVCEVLAAAGVHYIVLGANETFADVSPALRKINVSVDTWPIPPAGLFVVSERAVILRSTSSMTFFHETQHAIDLCLGGDAYFSSDSLVAQRGWDDARAFVTPYAASAKDEWFAESCRAWWGDIANDSHSLWPRVSRERLQAIDPAAFALVRWVFECEVPRLANVSRMRRATATKRAGCKFGIISFALAGKMIESPCNAEIQADEFCAEHLRFAEIENDHIASTAMTLAIAAINARE